MMTRNSIRNEAEQFAAEARAIAIHRVKSTPQEIYDDCADLYAAKIAQMNFASRLAFDLAFVDAMVEQAKDDFRKAQPDSFAENQVSFVARVAAITSSPLACMEVAFIFFALDEDFTSHLVSACRVNFWLNEPWLNSNALFASLCSSLGLVDQQWGWSIDPSMPLETMTRVSQGIAETMLVNYGDTMDTRENLIAALAPKGLGEKADLLSRELIKRFAVDDVEELLVSADAGRWEVIFEAQAKTSLPPSMARFVADQALDLGNAGRSGCQGAIRRFAWEDDQEQGRLDLESRYASYFNMNESISTTKTPWRLLPDEGEPPASYPSTSVAKSPYPCFSPRSSKIAFAWLTDPQTCFAAIEKAVGAESGIEGACAWAKYLHEKIEYRIENLGASGPHTQQVLGAARAFLDAKSLSHAARGVVSRPNRRLGRSL